MEGEGFGGGFDMPCGVGYEAGVPDVLQGGIEGQEMSCGDGFYDGGAGFSGDVGDLEGGGEVPDDDIAKEIDKYNRKVIKHNQKVLDKTWKEMNKAAKPPKAKQEKAEKKPAPKPISKPASKPKKKDDSDSDDDDGVVYYRGPSQRQIRERQQREQRIRQQAAANQQFAMQQAALQQQMMWNQAQMNMNQGFW